MTDQESVKKRTSIRLSHFDYRRTGVYFVTVCTHDQRSTLGMIVDGRVKLSPLGKLAETCWTSVPSHFPNVDLDLFVVMPNHFHALVAIDFQGDPSESKRKPGELRTGSLGAVIGSFKAAVTRGARTKGLVGAEPVWQRGFWEHIARSPEALARIQTYILENPSRWEFDAENDDRHSDDPFYQWIAEQGELPRNK